MPRTYIRKTIQKYSIEDVKKAVNDVKTKKLSLSKAAETYNVPKSTLCDYLKKKVIKLPNFGRNRIFSDDQETQLVNYITEYIKQYHGITLKIIRQIAYEYAEKNKLSHNFDRVKQLAGIDWYYYFIRRHPSMSPKILEARTQWKSLKCSEKKPSNKKIRRVLNNFNNVKELSDSRLNINEKGEKENEDFCIFCRDKYIEPPTEDWIMCYVCKKWTHERCADRQTKYLKGYKCNRCRK